MKITVRILIAANAAAFLLWAYTAHIVRDLKNVKPYSAEDIAVSPDDLPRVRSVLQMHDQIHTETIDLCSFYLLGAITLALLNTSLLLVIARKSSLRAQPA